MAPAVLPVALRRLTAAPTLVHFHFSTLGRVEHFLAAWQWGVRDRPYIVTIHGGRWNPARSRRPRDLPRFLRQASAVVAVSEPIAESATDRLGIPRERVRVIPAHLPGDTEPLPPSLEAQVRSLLVGDRKLLVASGSATALYGLQDVLEATSGDANRWAVVLATYGPSEPGYERRLAARQRGGVLRVHELPPGQFNALLRLAHAFVRPTAADGDAVAVREALAAGARVIATSSATRPAGVELYEFGRVDQLRARLTCAWQAARAEAPVTGGPDTWTELQALYDRVLDEVPG
jgi:hypothetical protein